MRVLTDNVCGELSPESGMPCILEGTEEAHRAGHEAPIKPYLNACWNTTGVSWWEVVYGEKKEEE